MPSKRQLEMKKLKAEIKQIWTESKSRYGAPKIHKTLISRGIKVSLKRVQRYMNAINIRSIVVKKFCYYSGKVTSDDKENILNRDFKTTGTNQKCALISLTFIQLKTAGLI